MAAGEAQLTEFPGQVVTGPGADQDGLTRPAGTRPASGTTAVLPLPGAGLVHEVTGDGPAVVLVHGFGLDLRMWEPQVGHLAARFRVVRYDCRGFGASGPFERLAAIAAQHRAWLVGGVDEREEHGATIYNTVLYFSPQGVLAGRHRKLVPTGSERTVWGLGDGSTLRVVDTGFGRLGGLICWENYMPLARFHLYSQGVEGWLAPTLAVAAQNSE